MTDNKFTYNGSQYIYNTINNTINSPINIQTTESIYLGTYDSKFTYNPDFKYNINAAPQNFYININASMSILHLNPNHGRKIYICA